MRKLIRASVLILALVVPTFAGNIPYGVTGEQSNGTNATSETQSEVTGEIPYGDTSQTSVINFLLAIFSLI